MQSTDSRMIAGTVVTPIASGWPSSHPRVPPAYLRRATESGAPARLASCTTWTIPVTPRARAVPPSTRRARCSLVPLLRINSTAATNSTTGRTAPTEPNQTRTTSSMSPPTGPAAWNQLPIAHNTASETRPRANPSRWWTGSMPLVADAPRPTARTTPPKPFPSPRHTPAMPAPTPATNPRRGGLGVAERRGPVVPALRAGRLVPDRAVEVVLAGVREPDREDDPPDRAAGDRPDVLERGRGCADVFPAMPVTLVPGVTPAPPATPTPAASGVASLQDPAHEVRLRRVFEAVVHHADQAHTQRHRRVPAIIDDPVEIGIRQLCEERDGLGVGGVEVADEQVRITGPDLIHLSGR